MVEWANVATFVTITLSTSMVLIATGFMAVLYQDINTIYVEVMSEMDEFKVLFRLSTGVISKML